MSIEEKEFELEGLEPGPILDNNEPKRSFLDIVYGVIFSPRQTMNIVGQQKPLGPSVALLLVINLLTIILLFVSFDSAQSFQNILPQMGIMPGAMKKLAFVISVSMFFIRLIFLFVIAGSYNLLGELLGGKSNGVGLLSALCLTAVPELFSVPLLFLGGLLPMGDTLNGLGNFLLGLWSLGLSILAVGEVLELSMGKSLMVIFLPLLIVLVIIVALVVMAVSMFIP